MEPASLSPLEKISPNLASQIAEFLTPKDLINLGKTSRYLRTLFFEFTNSWVAVAKNIGIPSQIAENLKSADDFKDALSKKVLKVDNYYVKIGLDCKSWLIFPASEIYYDWRDSNYWPRETHPESWFGETPIPHLHDVCWFRMHGDFTIPRGKYSFNFRIAADSNFNLNNSYFFLTREGNPEHLCKYVFTNEVEEQLINQKGFTILKLGEFDLSDSPEKEVKVLMGSQEGDSWWKHGFWLDAVVFIPI